MAVLSEYTNFPVFWTIVSSLVLALVVYVLFLVVKHIFLRWKFSSLPTVKFYWYDLLGVSQYIYPRNGYSVQTMFMQVAQGCSVIFPNEPFCVNWIGAHPTALAISPEAAQAVLTDNSLIEKAFIYKFVEPVIGKGLVTSKGSKWKPRRRMLNPTYHVSVLMDFIPIFNEHGSKLVKKLQKGTDGEIIELLKPISLCVLDIVSETILGTKIGAQEEKNKEYVDGLRTAFSLVMERIIKIQQWPGFIYRYTENYRILHKNQSILHGFTRSVMEQKKKDYLSAGLNVSETRKPLMDILLKFHMEKKNITEEDIIEEVDTFTAASNESTAASLMFTLHLLGLDKKIQANAHQELDDIFGDDKERPVEKEDLTKMKYIECILKESLRLFPTVPVMAREMQTDKTICGYTFPKGTTVIIIPFVLHRDPRLFPDPEKFDPSRFFPENCAERSQYAYIPFSAGARNCIGQKFAMIEMKVVLAHILRSFSVESLDPRDKVLAAAELSLRTDVPVRFRLFSRT